MKNESHSELKAGLAALNVVVKEQKELLEAYEACIGSTKPYCNVLSSAVDGLGPEAGEKRRASDDSTSTGKRQRGSTQQRVGRGSGARNVNTSYGKRWQGLHEGLIAKIDAIGSSEAHTAEPSARDTVSEDDLKGMSILDILPEHLHDKVIRVPLHPASDGETEDVPVLIRFHVSADLKCLYHLYGRALAWNANYPVVYNLMKWADKANGDKPMNDPQFRPGVVSDGYDDTKACLDIPMECAHWCTLHGEMRMDENIVNHLIAIPWALHLQTDNPLRDAAIVALDRIEGLLKEVGTYGGNYHIYADKEQANKHKPVTFNGTVARKISDHSSLVQSIIQALSTLYDVDTWTSKKVDLEECWLSYVAVVPYLR